MRAIFSIVALALALTLAIGLELAGQSPSLTLLSREGRRPLALTVANDQELVALDELANLFQLTVREESGALTVTYKGRTIVLTPDQALTSVAGRLVSLPSKPVRISNRWFVPVEFIGRALSLVYDTKLDLRRQSRLLVIGDLRVPRLTIRHDALGNGAQVTIDATPRASATVAQENERLIVKFDADALDLVATPIQSQGIVQNVRATDATTLTLDLGPRFGGFRATTETLENTTRIILDFTARQTDAAAQTPPPPAAPELPPLGQPASPIGTIVIDAGHGGDDTGAKGAQGTVEKDVTLAIARRLKATIEGRLGVRVILTRDEDRSVPLDERAAVANNNKANLFLSLHANASFKTMTRGAAVFVADLAEAVPSRTALTPIRLPVFGGGLREIALVPWDIAQLGHVTRSAEAARLMREAIQPHAPMTEGIGDRAPYRVLESANMPAVLIEMGYLTNPEDETQLAGAEFQTAFAQAIFEAILRFRDYLGTAAGGQR